MPCRSSPEPAPPQRHEYSAYLGYKLKLSDNLSLVASYRAALYDYPVYDRQDWNHVIVLGASYDFTTWARVSLSASTAWNRSSVEFFNYDNLVSGKGRVFTEDAQFNSPGRVVAGKGNMSAVQGLTLFGYSAKPNF